MPDIAAGAAALLKAQGAYNNGLTQKASLPKGVASAEANAVNFQAMAKASLNKFSKMSPEQILSQIKQTNSNSLQARAASNSGSLASSVGAMAKSIKTDEETKKRHIVGDASLTEVIEATIEAKTTLQKAVAVRNKALEAFEKIMNMPV